MMYKKAVFLFIILSFLLSKAQDAKAFSKIYSKTIIETSEKDFDKSLEIADSLYQTSTLPIFKLKSLMLSASLYQKVGKYEKAISFAEKAKEIADADEDYNWQTRINGFLATHYRLIKLYGKSQEYLKASIIVAGKIQSPELSNSALGLIYQEMAYSDLDMKKYQSSIKHLNESTAYFSKAGNIQNSEYLLANNDQLLGENYFYLGDYSDSEMYYLKAEKVLKLSPGFLLGLVYNGLAKIRMQQNNLEAAGIYIKKSEEIAEQSGHLALKEEVFKTNAEYYAKSNKPKEYSKSVKKYEIVSDTLAKNTSAFIDKQIQKMEQKEKETSEVSNNKSMVIAVFVIFLFLILFFWLVYNKRQKKQFARFRDILAELKQKDMSRQNVLQPILIKNSNAFNIQISEETLAKLLDSLKEFENSNGFTNKNMSLSFLAAELRTNVKYLSYIIKNYKNKDFANYINDLRIDYIIKKLREETAYRQYKISILADEAGFSSHSKFATVFKANTGLSPSLFIDYLRKEKDVV